MFLLYANFKTVKKKCTRGKYFFWQNRRIFRQYFPSVRQQDKGAQEQARASKIGEKGDFAEKKAGEGCVEKYYKAEKARKCNRAN